MLRFLLAGVALVMAGCAVPQPAGEPEAPDHIIVDGQLLVDGDGIIHMAVQEKLNADEGLCRANGGAFQRVCMMGNTMCVIRFADAGETCSDGADCQSGRCYGAMDAQPGAAATGKCAPTNDPCGCFQRIVNGRAEPALCVD